jgi:hypothetical protein
MDRTIDKTTTEGEEEEASIEITIVTTITVLTAINHKIVLPLMIKDLFLFLDQRVLLGRKWS